jgi:hypothetical protein
MPCGHAAIAVRRGVSHRAVPLAPKGAGANALRQSPRSGDLPAALVSPDTSVGRPSSSTGSDLGDWRRQGRQENQKEDR